MPEALQIDLGFTPVEGPHAVTGWFDLETSAGTEIYTSL